MTLPTLRRSRRTLSRGSIRLTVGTALAAVCLTGCGLFESSPDTRSPAGRPAFPAGSTMERIQKKGELVVGVKFDTPLFGLQDPATGRLAGFDVEIARLIARDLTGSAEKVRFVETVAKQRESSITDRSVDMVVATYTMNAEREQIVDFAGPYYMAGQDTLVRTEESRIRKVDDLAGRAVCAASGSTSAERLRSRVPGVKLFLVTRDSECLPALVNGKIDAVSTDDTILLSLMTGKPGAFRMLGKPFSSEPYGIGVANNDTVFRDYINGLLRRYVEDGSWDRAYRDTVGTVAKGMVPIRPQISGR
jgi:glutamate transport system substrate-binding protein